MKTIIITGPSGLGKTFFTNKLSKLLVNPIVLETDSYYRDNILVKLLSLLKKDIYDRTLSFKRKEITMTLNSIYDKERMVTKYNYDFMNKKSVKTKIRLNYMSNNQFLILEGIFAHRLNLDYQETVNIECCEKKGICYKRRIKRDKIERGRKINEIKKRFSQSWYLFYKNFKDFKTINHVITLNPSEKITNNELINILNSKSIK